MRHTMLAAAAAFVLSSVFATAHARDVSFTVVNQTGSTLDALYGGPSSQDDWGSNVLQNPIEDGGSMTVTITGTETCGYDFRYEVEGKEPYEEYGIDICEIDGQEFTIK